MAERVQVQGLGGAVPGISPTIQRAGQYAVQVEQAGRNRWQDLADALGEVNPMLQQYTRVADIEFEQFQEKVARMSPEQLKADLNKTEAELDKQVRKGSIPFLASPLNWKRKKRALGARLHDEYQKQLHFRLNNPEAGDEDVSTEAIASIIRQDFEGQYGQLATDVFVKEGFDEVVRPTIDKYVLEYDTRKNKEAEKQVQADIEARLFSDGTLDLDDPRYATRLDEVWAETNWMTADKQVEMIERVTRQLAVKNPQAAKNFLEHASGHFKVGTARFGVGAKRKGEDPIYGAYTNRKAVLMEEIDKIEEQNILSDKKEATDILYNIQAELVAAGMAFKSNGQATIEGVDAPIRSQDELENAFRQKLLETGNPIVITEGVKAIQTTLGALEIEQERGVFFLNMRRTMFPRIDFSKNLEDDKNSLLLSEGFAKREGTRISINMPKVLSDEITELETDLKRKLLVKRNEISTGQYKNVNDELVRTSDLQNQGVLDLLDFEKKFQEEFNQGAKDIFKKYRASKQVSEVEAESPKNIDDKKSFINPEVTLGQGSTYWFNSNYNFIDLEAAIRKKDTRAVRNISKNIGQYNFDKLVDEYNTIQDNTKNLEERKLAERKLLVYLMGSNRVNLESIRAGEINIAGPYGVDKTLNIPITNKEALKDLVPFYAFFPKERYEQLRRESESGIDSSVDDIEELLKLIYETQTIPQETVEKFIEVQEQLFEQ
jgi:hypothetical protein